jgi:hypothetical protein
MPNSGLVEYEAVEVGVGVDWWVLAPEEEVDGWVLATEAVVDWWVLAMEAEVDWWVLATVGLDCCVRAVDADWDRMGG